jgi:hypothetical protein
LSKKGVASSIMRMTGVTINVVLANANKNGINPHLPFLQ